MREIKGKSPYKWTGTCAVELVQKEGIRLGLFRGFSSVLLREVPQFAVYYPTYEWTKIALSDVLDHATLVQFLAGSTAGVVQWLPPIYFADVLKSRMQTAAPGRYDSVMSCVREILAEEGWRGFFRYHHCGICAIAV